MLGNGAALVAWPNLSRPLRKRTSARGLPWMWSWNQRVSVRAGSSQTQTSAPLLAAFATHLPMTRP